MHSCMMLQCHAVINPCMSILQTPWVSFSLLFQRYLVHLVAMCRQALGGIELAMTFCKEIAMMLHEQVATKDAAAM